MRTKGPGESALLLLDAVSVLREQGVTYAVIGAMAASVHGVVRASMDADAILSLPLSALPGLERTFQSAGFQTELRRGDIDDPISSLLAVSDQFGNRVDLLVGLRGLEETAFRRSINVAFEGETLRVIGREDFIAMKVFAGGPQDVADAANVLEAAAGTLDLELLRRLAERYGRDTADSLRALLAKRRHS
ncbi:MAG TPA: hypothetical protein VHE11_00590 [Steroidobacteraceae bacterium]|nr:hypothetical protein [Steroidobacteraceae bacterium]